MCVAAVLVVEQYRKLHHAGDHRLALNRCMFSVEVVIGAEMSKTPNVDMVVCAHVCVCALCCTALTTAYIVELCAVSCVPEYSV